MAKPTKSELTEMFGEIIGIWQEKQRQGDYSADAPAIRALLQAVIMLFDNVLSKGKVRGKIPRRRPRKTDRNKGNR